MKYFVDIVRHEGGEVVDSIDCGPSERKADRVESGVMVNMNHDDYYTVIRAEGDA